MEVILSFFTENFWATALSVGTLVSFISSVVINYFNPVKIVKQIITWVLALGCTVGCYYGGLITVAEPNWLTLLLTGLVVGLSSNGIYEIGEMKSYVNTFGKTIANIFKK